MNESAQWLVVNAGTRSCRSWRRAHLLYFYEYNAHGRSIQNLGSMHDLLLSLCSQSTRFPCFFQPCLPPMALRREWLAIPATAITSNIFHDISLLLAYNPSAFLSKPSLTIDTPLLSHIATISTPASSQCHSQSPVSAGQQQPASLLSSLPKAAVTTSSP